MSWDILIQDLPRDSKSTSEIPGDFRPQPLGRRADLIDKLKELFPDADFSDPSWGRIEAADWSIEVNIGTSEECESMMLHVRGGDSVVGVVAGILDHLDLRALDCETGEFFVAGPQALASFRKWRTYRDQVAKNGGG